MIILFGATENSESMAGLARRMQVFDDTERHLLDKAFKIDWDYEETRMVTDPIQTTVTVPIKDVLQT